MKLRFEERKSSARDMKTPPRKWAKGTTRGLTLPVWRYSSGEEATDRGKRLLPREWITGLEVPHVYWFLLKISRPLTGEISRAKSLRKERWGNPLKILSLVLKISETKIFFQPLKHGSLFSFGNCENDTRPRLAGRSLKRAWVTVRSSDALWYIERMLQRDAAQMQLVPICVRKPRKINWREDTATSDTLERSRVGRKELPKLSPPSKEWMDYDLWIINISRHFFGDKTRWVFPHPFCKFWDTTFLPTLHRAIVFSEPIPDDRKV